MGWMAASQQHMVDYQPSVTLSFTKVISVTFRQLSIHWDLGEETFVLD